MGLFSNPYSERKKVMIDKDQALYGRDEKMNISGVHFVSGNPIVGPFDEKYQIAYFALGCFWGAEKLFWKIDGVFSTAVGFQGGYTKNPTFEESCGGGTGHAETVMVVFDPRLVSYENLVIKFFEGHDPTQYMGQGNDIGTEYRSAIFPTTQEQFGIAMNVKDSYNKTLLTNGMGEITTEIYQLPTPPFYYAEEYHQQYLGKNPNGYCNLRGTGVVCAI
jgi:peptide-methionine (S)-S-oxide reductase